MSETTQAPRPPSRIQPPAFLPGPGWEREKDGLFIHETGDRIRSGTYRGVQGWFLIPAELDLKVLVFPPTPEGRDAAFAAFAEGRHRPPPTPPKASRRARPKKEEEEPEEKADVEGDDDVDVDELLNG